jgi:hypothetical protein
LLCPFEVLSRPSVSTAVKHLAEREAGLDAKTNDKAVKSDEHAKERNDSFADDHMLEDAFAHAPRDQQHEIQDIEDGFEEADVVEVDRGDEMNHGFIVAEEEHDMEEVEIAENEMDMDMDEELEVDDGSDEDMSGSEDSEESSSDEEGSSSEDDEDDDDDDDDDEDDS